MLIEQNKVNWREKIMKLAYCFIFWSFTISILVVIKLGAIKIFSVIIYYILLDVVPGTVLRCSVVVQFVLKIYIGYWYRLLYNRLMNFGIKGNVELRSPEIFYKQ